MNRQTQTQIKINTQIHIQIDRCLDKYFDGHVNNDKQTIQIGRQVDRQIDRNIHSQELTQTLTMAPWKSVFLYQPVVFRVHVSLPGCTLHPYVQGYGIHMSGVCHMIMTCRLCAGRGMCTGFAQIPIDSWRIFL